MKKVTKWVLKVHMSMENEWRWINKFTHVKQSSLSKHWCQVCIYFSKYNYYFRYYIVGGYYFVFMYFLLLWEFSQIKFAILMIFDQLISLYFFVSFIIPPWVWISMNYTLPHPITMILLLNFIHTLLRKEWAWISTNCTPGQFYHYTFIFRDFSHSCMGVSKSSTSNQEVTIIIPNKRVQ